MEVRSQRLARIGVLLVIIGVAAAAWAATGIAGSSALSGSITADGSSTVGPWTTAAAEMFRKKHPGVRITVGISGTGGGFERFCRGETDLSNASRPIRSTEYAKCRENGVKWVAFVVANDGISLVVNRSNTWAHCLTTAELKKIWDRGSNVHNWSDVRAGFPNVPLKLYGPGTDSGTFEFFTEAINGRARQSRSDYSASEDDNILVQGVSGDRGAMGYFGLSYYEENRSRLKVLRVDSGGGCVAPNKTSVQSRRYKPLSRPLFIYAKRESFRRSAVRAFIGYALNNQAKVAQRARFVPLTKAQSKSSRSKYQQALRQIR
jgi:phosphate transport system substrate-binding protein